MKTLLALPFVALLASSCVSEFFTLNEGTSQVVYGRIMSHLDSVETVGRAALKVHSGGVAAIRNYDITQCRWDLSATLTKGTETIYRVRTLPIEKELIPSIDIIYSTSGCRVEEEGRLLANHDSVQAVRGVESKIQVTNDGDYLTVVIGCTRVFHRAVEKPSTEWLVVESPTGSEVVLARVDTEETR